MDALAAFKKKNCRRTECPPAQAVPDPRSHAMALKKGQLLPKTQKANFEININGKCNQYYNGTVVHY